MRQYHCQSHCSSTCGHQCPEQAAGIIWAEVISAAVSAATRQSLSSDTACFSSYCSSASDTRQQLCSTRYRRNSPVSRQRSAQCLRESFRAGPWHGRCCKCCPSAPAVLACHHFAELLRRCLPSQASSTCMSCRAPPALQCQCINFTVTHTTVKHM